MKKNHLFALLITLIVSTPVFSQINFLSPIEGIWANKQMLVIDNPDSGDYFYSIDGSDPEAFGFAYDGPVLLDVTGDIQLKVTYVSPSGTKDKVTVGYSVKLDSARDTNYKSFIQGFFDSGILNYSAGSVLAIPQKLSYTIGNLPDCYLPGQNIMLSKECVLSRYIPCILQDEQKNVKYRFIIKTYPQSAGIYSKRDVPFSIVDWETIYFNDRNLLYKIDSEYWGLPSEPRKIDRSVSHMISWQSIDYETGNPIEFFVLPPKPEFLQTKNQDGSIVYSLKGTSDFTMGLYSEEHKSYMELFPQIGVDAFFGDSTSGQLDIGIFANSVYQGKVVTDYNIDKRPPVEPLIKSSAKSFYSRDKVHVEVNTVPGTELYIALSEPCIVPETSEVYTQESEIIKNIEAGQFRKVKDGKFNITWGPKGAGPAYYKLIAYAKRGQNESYRSEYSVIVDQSSYYFDEKADTELAEGTAEHPFTSFEQCVTELKNMRAVTLRVKGNLLIDSRVQLNSNYEFINNGNAVISFGEKGSICMKGSSLEFSDCRIKNKDNTKNNCSEPLIRLENSVLTMKNCTTGIDFTKNATFVDAYNSIINISDSIFAVNSTIYASLISSVKSRISIKKATVSVASETGVVISANQGSVKLSDSTISVSGDSGRVAELFGVKADFKDNTFKAQLTRLTGNPSPVYVNSETTLSESGTVKYGF